MIAPPSQPLPAQFSRSVAANLAFWRGQAGRVTPRSLGRLDGERHNLFRAVEIGLALEETWRGAAELMVASFDFVERRGYWREWLPLLRAAVARCSPADLALKGRLLDQLGLIYQFERRLDAALATHEEEEQIGLALGDRFRLAHARLHLSEVYSHQRRYGEAERYGRAAQADFEACGGDPEKLAHVTGHLGTIAMDRGDYERAETQLRQAAAYWRDLDHATHLARMLNNLAITYYRRAEHATALAVVAEAEATLAGTAYELDRILLAITGGVIAFEMGDVAAARAAFERANSPYLRQAGYRAYEAMVATNLGNVCLAEKRFVEAEAYLSRSAEIYRQLDDRLSLANALGDLAQALAGQGKEARGGALYLEAARLAADFPENAVARDMVEKFERALAGGAPAEPSGP
jgi:tetratricopeptide (TPR) repeat protein